MKVKTKFKLGENVYYIADSITTTACETCGHKTKETSTKIVEQAQIYGVFYDPVKKEIIYHLFIGMDKPIEFSDKKESEIYKTYDLAERHLGGDL